LQTALKPRARAPPRAGTVLASVTIEHLIDLYPFWQA
jgi:hypothetical protein